eukprot:932929-Rhodomonas_salina.1
MLSEGSRAALRARGMFSRERLVKRQNAVRGTQRGFESAWDVLYSYYHRDLVKRCLAPRHQQQHSALRHYASLPKLRIFERLSERATVAEVTCHTSRVRSHDSVSPSLKQRLHDHLPPPLLRQQSSKRRGDVRERRRAVGGT